MATYTSDAFAGAALHAAKNTVLSGIVGVGTATPNTSYAQAELLDMHGIEDRRVRSLFLNGSIERRSLTLPPPLPDGTRPVETQGDLLRKHREQGIAMGSRALSRCVESAKFALSDIAYLCCVSTTGLLTPGLTARLCRELELPRDCVRLDVVGMGCNAGLNALNSVAAWSQAHPGKLAILCCIEVCSAAYLVDETMRTSVVNSLFGDGAAAIAVIAGQERPGTCSIVKFASALIPEALEAMRYDWDDDHGKFSFFLDREIPYVIGANCEALADRLLDGTGLRRTDIAHWIVHAGGKKVVDSVRVNLGLTVHDLRHTLGVLRDYGNVSSGSFLFSLERLIGERVVAPGDYGVMMTMGPGTTIEMALVRWSDD